MNPHLLSRLLSRVLFPGRSPSPGGDHSSVRLPETLGEQPVAPLSVLLRVGFTCNRLLPAARWSLTPPFHPYLCPKAIGGLLSAALASGSLRLGFPKHSALWSPDFPRSPPERRPRSSCLLSFCENRCRCFASCVWCPERESNPHAIKTAGPEPTASTVPPPGLDLSVGANGGSRTLNPLRARDP